MIRDEIEDGNVVVAVDDEVGCSGRSGEALEAPICADPLNGKIG